MKRFKSIISASFLLFLIPVAIVAGQDKKSEQKIKIIISDNGGSEVVLDTLISGNATGDSIVLKNGRTIYLAEGEGGSAPGQHITRKYIVTSDGPDGDHSGKEVRKEITVVSSDSDTQDNKGQMTWTQAGCGSSEAGKTYSFTVTSDNKAANSENTKYVINRDGVVITVEASDYARVRELVKEIEKTLDAESKSRE
jgi:hypothetical protein